jgi:hypothetical protein
MERFDEVVHLDIDTGSAEWLTIEVTTAAARQEVEQIAFDGIASRLDGREVLFYRYREALHIRFDNQDFVLCPTISLTVVKLCGRKRRVKISQKGSVQFEWTYRLPDDVELKHDFTPFRSEEDYDICIFAQNVLHNPRRRDQLFRRKTL